MGTMPARVPMGLILYRLICSLLSLILAYSACLCGVGAVFFAIQAWGHG